MSRCPQRFSRRTFHRVVMLGVPGSVLLQPGDADARFLGILFRVGGFGLAAAVSALGIGGIGLLTFYAIGRSLVGYGRHAIFSGSPPSRYGGHSSTSYSAHAPTSWERPRVPPKPIIIQLSLDPSAQLAGDILRIRAMEFNLLRRDGIELPSGGRLMIEEDGRMQFADTRFRGYATMRANGDLSVFTPEDRLVYVRSPRHGTMHNINHDSHAGQTAVASLLGEVRHV